MNFSKKWSITFLAEDHHFRIAAFSKNAEPSGSFRPKWDSLTEYSHQLMIERDTIRNYNPKTHRLLILGDKNIVMAFNKLHFSAFDFLIKNQIDEQRRKSLLRKGMDDRQLLEKSYRLSVINRGLTAVGIPILLWLILETFFR